MGRIKSVKKLEKDINICHIFQTTVSKFKISLFGNKFSLMFHMSFYLENYIEKNCQKYPVDIFKLLEFS
ncbi:hypothetical protein BpHYR1_023256 [Brachionus plicatilis]|uniref:Uncharacterized protein n=1 Tax=Brachionus plicatilis TaxID=10195 RepID=A0A3M7Q4K3_BRAPC|nr:hypothetical protein BpHYR1_023256 [Brachionus plicatilis]